MNTGMLRRAQPAASCGIPRRQSTWSSRMLLPRGGDQGMHAPLEPGRISSERVKHQGTRSQSAHSGTTEATSAHVTCENVARGTFLAAQRAISVKEREGGLDTDPYSFIPSRTPSRQAGQEVGQGLNARNPRARRLLAANTGILRRAQPAAPYGTPRHQKRQP